MLQLDGLMICVTRGDTAWLTLRFEGLVPSDGTEAWATLKRHVGDAVPIWKKRLVVVGGAVTLRLTTADTELPFGLYRWDLRLRMDGETLTPFSPQIFEIAEVVGDA
ncbi:MAG: hypothetical protein RSC98_05245 [Clostridia bacterium]